MNKWAILAIGALYAYAGLGDLKQPNTAGLMLCYAASCYFLYRITTGHP